MYYEVSKNYETITVQQKLFQLWFQTGKVPQPLRKALIYPNPKDTAVKSENTIKL